MREVEPVAITQCLNFIICSSPFLETINLSAEINLAFPLIILTFLLFARPESPLYAQFSDVLQREISSVLTGKQKLEVALRKAEKNTQRIISSAGNI